MPNVFINENCRRLLGTIADKRGTSMAAAVNDLVEYAWSSGLVFGTPGPEYDLDAYIAGRIVKLLAKGPRKAGGLCAVGDPATRKRALAHLVATRQVVEHVYETRTKHLRIYRLPTEQDHLRWAADAADAAARALGATGGDDAAPAVEGGAA